MEYSTFSLLPLCPQCVISACYEWTSRGFTFLTVTPCPLHHCEVWVTGREKHERNWSLVTQSIETWAKVDKHFSVLKNSNRTRQMLSISSLALSYSKGELNRPQKVGKVWERARPPARSTLRFLPAFRRCSPTCSPTSFLPFLLKDLRPEQWRLWSGSLWWRKGNEG